MQKQIGKYEIQLTIIHTKFKENETGRVFDFQSNAIYLIKSLCLCCCCCGCCCCCCYLFYQGSMLLLLLSIFLRVYVVVIVVICLIKGLCCCCCWLLVLLLVYIYVLMCLFSTSINKVRVIIIISQQHFICLPLKVYINKFVFGKNLSGIRKLSKLFQFPINLYITRSVHKRKRVQLMCALMEHINKFIFGKILLRIEKVVRTFSIQSLHELLFLDWQCP